MDLLVIGDVHGCYHTLSKLLKDHWNPEECLLIQAGDMVNKGPHSVACIKLWMDLEKRYPEKVYMIRGNHEQRLIQAIRRPYILNTCSRVRAAIKKSDISVKAVRKWLESLPLKWENDKLLITHAGIAKKARNPYKTGAKNGVLFNKGSLKRLDKVQVKGHSIVNGHKPVFNPSENAWYIDTGAWTKKYLSAIRFSEDAEKKQVIRVKTQAADQVVKFSLV